MIEIKNLPTLEELSDGIRKIKVTIPEKRSALDKELLFMRVQGATYTNTDIINVNDIAVLNVSGKTDRYNKDSVEVTVGLNLYNEAIEENLAGMRINEEKSVTVDGDLVKFKVLSIKKKVYSELDLEKVKAEDPSINSVAAYEDKIYNEICEKIIKEKATPLLIKPMIKKLLDTTNVKYEMSSDIDEDFVKFNASQFNGMGHDEIIARKKSVLINGDYDHPSLKDGMSREDLVNSLSESELDEYFDYGTIVDVGNDLKEIAFCEANGIDLSKEAYEKYADEMSSRYNMPAESFIQRYPYFAFRYFNTNTHLDNILLEYLKKDYITLVVK